jgi:molybdopterin molybdotransferase
MEMHAFGRLLPMEVAARRVLLAAHPVDRTESVAIVDAFDRVAAAPVRAPQPVPTFPRANWDGYAARSRDLRSARRDAPVSLRVVGEVYAEGGFRGRLGPGQAAAIATGGALPPGADTVVIFEDVVRTGPTIEVPHSSEPGERLAAPGSDFARGRRLVERGQLLDPAAIAALAACGIARVTVYARPKVAIVPNGNELVSPGGRVRTGEIFESNNAALSAVVTAAGGVATPRPPVPDEPARIEGALRRALKESDLVLATGGSSVGEHDFLPQILPRLGRLLFHGIAVRPGKPTLAAAAGRKLVLGLPGHPSSCLANSYWLVLPAIRRMARRAGPGWVEGEAVLGEGVLAPSPGLATVVPLVRRGRKVFSVYHGSASITSMSGATGYAVLPAGTRRVSAGRHLTVRWLLPPLGSAAAGVR